jgi:hypothetical protein
MSHTYGNIPTWGSNNELTDGISQSSAGGSGMTLIGSYDSAVNGTIANYTLTWTGTYKKLLLITKNITGDGPLGYFCLQISDNSGSTWGNEINVNRQNLGSFSLPYSITNMYNTSISGLTKNMIIASNPSYDLNGENSYCWTSAGPTGVINGIRYSYIGSAGNITGGRIFVYGVN